MMWHFYEIPYIPDLELVKYQSLGEQGILLACMIKEKKYGRHQYLNSKSQFR